MAVFEKHKLSGKNREFWTVMLLVVRDAQARAGVSSIWTKLRPLGSIMLGGELDQRPKDSVWWVDDVGLRTRIHTDFGKWKKDVKLAAAGFGVDDKIKERNRTRWGNALTVAAIAGAVIATVASGGAAAAIIGPTAAGILATTGAVVGTTSAALREMVGSSGEGLTLAEIAAGFAEGEEFYQALSEGTILDPEGAYTLPGLMPYTVPDRPGVGTGAPQITVDVPPVADEEPPPADDEPREDVDQVDGAAIDVVPVIVGGVLLAGAAALTVAVVGGLAYAASRRAA